MTNHWLKSDYFQDIIVIDNNGEPHTVPCITSNDIPDIISGDVIRLPMLQLCETPEYGLCLIARSFWRDDLDQILEQVIYRLGTGGMYDGDLKLRSIASNKVIPGKGRIHQYIFRLTKVS